MTATRKIYWARCLPLCLLVFGAGFFSLLFGTVSLPPIEVFSSLINPQDTPTDTIIWEIRMPRMILGVMVGASLGLSGAALQGLLRNPLADPGVIGVSASAGLGAVMAIYLGFTATFALALPLFALAGALISTFLLFTLANRDASVLTLILVGIGISSLAVSMTSLVMNFAPNPFSLQDMILWLLGSLDNRSYADIRLAGPFIILGWFLLAFVGRGLTALTLGEDTARTLGIDLRRLRLLIILGVSLSVGASVAVCGTIGFVGLVMPHMARRFFGHDPSQILLPSALGGAFLLTLADLITRLPISDNQLRLGVITAFIGAPFFLYIVVKTREAMR